jgi:GT2 family glycosyltransferase
LQLSVIIVNYNVKHFLEQCLLSVQKAGAGIATEIFVVDNASNDGSREYLQTKFAGVKFEWNKENTGFAKACNQVIAKSTGRYILFLNPDTIIAEDCFEKCIAFLESRKDAGALGIRMLDGRGSFLPESKRAFPSPLTSMYKLSGLSALFPRSKTFAKYHLGYLDEKQTHEIDVMAGAFIMIKREVLDKTGGFDESFFMYGEDVDLSYRIQKAGYKNFYFSESTVLHFKGESTRKGSLNYVRMFYLAMSRFVQKHYSSSKAGLFTALIKFAIWGRALLSVIKRFILKLGLPLLDALFIFLSYRLAKFLWTNYVRKEIIYKEPLLWYSFAGFTLLFLLVSYYTGLYEKKFSFKYLLRSVVISLFIILSIYALLPESLRFSRGIVAGGSFITYIVLIVWRWILLQTQVIQKAENDHEQLTLVAGTAADLHNVNDLLHHTGRHESIKGFISPLGEEHSLGHLSQMETIMENTTAKELILCESEHLSFQQIINLFEANGKRVKLRLHAKGSRSIIGSDSKNEAGQVLNIQQYQLARSVNLRLKRLIDVVTSAVFLISFPVHFIFNRQAAGLLANSAQVLLKKKTWVGFAVPHHHLPVLQPSVVNSAAIPHSQSQLNAEGLLLADEWYAKEYDPVNDIRIIFSAYKKLGCR